MSREITDDYKELIIFFKQYSISKIAVEKDYISIISRVHKRYFVYLTITSELAYLSKADSKLTPIFISNQLEYLKESCSDVGNAIFCLINGSYKPSNLILRSSIETFLKGFNLDEYTDITTEKSVYKIFNNIKALPRFQDEPYKNTINDMHQIYGKLCEETHTADVLNMAHITSMNYFPKFDKDKAEEIADNLTKLINNYTTILLLKYSNYYHKMHFKNKQNILSIISGDLKRKLQGIDN
ncbi:hypothetical protein [Myroides odoratus]|uniref:hypothetical protein n=1 Tax=Myroides odoratus TaxID=256 RepID=UPI00333E6453